MIDREFALIFNIIIPLVNGIIVALQRLILGYSIGYLMGYTFRCHQSCLAWTIPYQWSVFFNGTIMYISLYIYMHEWMKDFPANHVQLPWLISCFIRNGFFGRETSDLLQIFIPSNCVDLYNTFLLPRLTIFLLGIWIWHMFRSFFCLDMADFFVVLFWTHNQRLFARGLSSDLNILVKVSSLKPSTCFFITAPFAGERFYPHFWPG